MEALLQKVKTALRIKHSALDTEILDNIQECLLDLRLHGIVHKGEEDPLIQNAIKLYCKTQYSDDPDLSDAYGERYRELRSSLKLAEGYGWVSEVADNAD